MAEELRLASQVQRGLLPPPLDHPRLDLAAEFIPVREIGGDYYDVFPLDSDRLAVTLGDVMGKGVPAALLAANLKACLRAHVETAGGRPGRDDRPGEPDVLGRDAQGPVRDALLRGLRLRPGHPAVRQRRARAGRPGSRGRPAPSCSTPGARCWGCSRSSVYSTGRRPGGSRTTCWCSSATGSSDRAARLGGALRRDDGSGRPRSGPTATRSGSLCTPCSARSRAGPAAGRPRTTRRSSWPRCADSVRESG